VKNVLGMEHGGNYWRRERQRLPAHRPGEYADGKFERLPDLAAEIVRL